MIKANVKVTAILVNPPGVIENVIPVEYPDETYAKSAVLRVLAGVRQMGLMRDLGEAHLQWVSADSPRVDNIELQLQVVAIADNLDMSAAIKAAATQAAQQKGILKP